jgi:tryptophan synthase beta chain
MSPHKINLDEASLPAHWYNLNADLPLPAPPLHPGTHQPVGPEDLAPLFPMSIIMQEVSGEAQHEIPAEVREAYRIWRPTPLMRAERFEQALGVKGVRIYYKYEGGSPSGSHKPNTAVPQAFYCAQDGRKRIATETGAGQWGSALSYATQLYGLECEVFMVGISYRQKPYRRVMMETFGGTVHSSPSDVTNAGRAALETDPESLGSLGLAISEAVERAATDPEAAYSLGSVLNHVLMHQTVIGLEAKEQLALAGEERPDVIIASCGGGSNLSGISLPFVPDAGVRLVAVEPSSCPTLTGGRFEYDFGDTAGMTPLLAMYTLGHDFVPPPIHAGGLRYHGDAPIVSNLVKNGRMEAIAYPQGKVFEAAVQWARTQGTIPAPETSHAIRAVVDEALAAKEEGAERVILFNYSGHGLLDLGAYDDYLHDRLDA